MKRAPGACHLTMDRAQIPISRDTSAPGNRKMKHVKEERAIFGENEAEALVTSLPIEISKLPLEQGNSLPNEAITESSAGQ